MQGFISRKLLWLYQRVFIQVAQQTLVALFPFVLLAAFAQISAQSVFSEHGFISQLFSISAFSLPTLQALSAV